MSSTILIQALIVVIGYVFYWQLFRKPRKNLPPGPKGLPLVGNILTSLLMALLILYTGDPLRTSMDHLLP